MEHKHVCKYPPGPHSPCVCKCGFRWVPVTNGESETGEYDAPYRATSTHQVEAKMSG